MSTLKLHKNIFLSFSKTHIINREVDNRDKKIKENIVLKQMNNSIEKKHTICANLKRSKKIYKKNNEIYFSNFLRCDREVE
jgi:hypothetical protein